MNKTELSTCYGIAQAIEKEGIALFGHPYVNVGFSKRKSGKYSFSIWTWKAEEDKQIVYHSPVNELSLAFSYFEGFLLEKRGKKIEKSSKSTKGNKINFSDCFWNIEEAQQRARIILKSWYAVITISKNSTGFYVFDITGPEKRNAINSIQFKSKNKTLPKAISSLVDFFGEEIEKIQ
jgi:hypothetical protein